MLKPTQYFIELRGRKCECCGLNTMALQRHHWLFHRMKGHPELDVEQNIGLVCERCHQSGNVSSYESKVRFWKIQKQRYDMINWWKSLPLIEKEMFDDPELIEYCNLQIALPAIPKLQS